MGEFAEYQLAREMRRGTSARSNYKGGRNPISEHCPYCGKGIRPIAGSTVKSMAAHIKSKHKDQNNAV